MDKRDEMLLTLSLSEAIGKWIDESCETEQWSGVGYIGPDAAELMARSAMCCLLVSEQGQDALRDNKKE